MPTGSLVSCKTLPKMGPKPGQIAQPLAHRSVSV
jgi:hypothetical protein